MGWARGWDHIHDREVGYGVVAKCDQPGCEREIDRGLDYRCGGCDFDKGCGLHFCHTHLFFSFDQETQVCLACLEAEQPRCPLDNDGG